MATQLFKETMIQLSADYAEYRKETLNKLSDGEGKLITLTFKDYASQYFSFLETFDPFDGEEDEDLDEEQDELSEEE